jgi:hypothetical protein
MSILGDIFGTGSTTTTSGSTPSIPGDVEAARRNLLTRAQNFAAEPFAQYNLPRVAGFSPDQEAAFGAARNIASQSGALAGLTPELTREGIEASRGLATTLPETDISAYMSPYLQGVLDPAIRDIEERAARQRLQLGQQAARTGSFGGSRQAIAESELERGTQRNIGEESARQRANAYTQALQQFRTDQERIPALYAGAQGMLGTGLGQTAGRLATEYAPLLQAGGLQQQLGQTNLDVLRRSFEEERDFPMRGIETLRGALGLNSNTLGVGTTQTQTTPGSSNVLGSVIGAAAAIPSVIQGGKSLWDWGSSLFG